MSKGVKPFIIKRGDTAPSLIATIYDKGCLGQSGRFNLSGATSVSFSMTNQNGALIISSNIAQIVSASNGIIQYSWQEGDTEQEGNYYGEFEIIFGDGKKMSLPREGFINIKITEDINKI
jgi:hypothetical protein